MKHHDAVNKLNAHKGLEVSEANINSALMGILYEDDPQTLKRYLIGNNGFAVTHQLHTSTDGDWIGVSIPGMNKEIRVSVERADGRIKIGEAS
jgi:hypothetical protein